VPFNQITESNSSSENLATGLSRNLSSSHRSLEVLNASEVSSLRKRRIISDTLINRSEFKIKLQQESNYTESQRERLLRSLERALSKRRMSMTDESFRYLDSRFSLLNNRIAEFGEAHFRISDALHS
jgi:hypothetical protein